MKKLQIFILIIVVAGLFAFADYYVNVPEGIPTPSLPSVPAQQQTQTSAPPEVRNDPNITKQILEQSGLGEQYKIEKRARSTELFETFDLSAVSNISAYKNILIKIGAATQIPVYAYEIHGPAGQGSITYLNLKLAMIDQLGSEAGINETGDLGYSNLYYNAPSNAKTAYLLTQVGDVVFGFQYSKDSQEAFDFVKSLVNNYMSLISNNT